MAVCSATAGIDCIVSDMGNAGPPSNGSRTPIGRIFTDRTAARAGLTGAAGRAANRFFRGATSKSIEFSIASLPGGRFHLAYFSPARNVGYGKQYHQIINVEGFVLHEFKETWGPDGLIETKWIHGAPDDQ